MFRKATAFLLLILLGLYLPAAGTTACLCIDLPDPVETTGCCVEATSCCDMDEADTEPCCGDPECCILVPALPEGMEPQLTLAPLPVTLPNPATFEDTLITSPSGKVVRASCSLVAPKPQPGAPIRIAFGVWRL